MEELYKGVVNSLSQEKYSGEGLWETGGMMGLRSRVQGSKIVFSKF